MLQHEAFPKSILLEKKYVPLAVWAWRRGLRLNYSACAAMKATAPSRGENGASSCA